MTTGSQSDFVSRIKAVLPLGWFPPTPATGEATSSPILDGVLAGPGNQFAAIWQLILYFLLQTRIATSTGSFIDMVALDYFGAGNLTRNMSEVDAAYRTRVLDALFPARVTRPAVTAVLTRLMGASPLIVEPQNASDTKGLGSYANPAAGGGYGYDSPGLYYGSMVTPFQTFVQVNNSTAQLPLTTIFETVSLALPESEVLWLQIAT